MPRQGWMYLSVHHLCFYAYILGKETKFIVRWADITDLDKTNGLLFPDSIRVGTRDHQVVIIFKILILYIIELIKILLISYIFIVFFTASFFYVFKKIRNVFINGTINKFSYEAVCKILF